MSPELGHFSMLCFAYEACATILHWGHAHNWGKDKANMKTNVYALRYLHQTRI